VGVVARGDEGSRRGSAVALFDLLVHDQRRPLGGHGIGDHLAQTTQQPRLDVDRVLVMRQGEVNAGHDG